MVKAIANVFSYNKIALKFCGARYLRIMRGTFSRYISSVSDVWIVFLLRFGVDKMKSVFYS